MLRCLEICFPSRTEPLACYYYIRTLVGALLCRDGMGIMCMEKPGYKAVSLAPLQRNRQGMRLPKE